MHGLVLRSFAVYLKAILAVHFSGALSHVHRL